MTKEHTQDYNLKYRRTEKGFINHLFGNMKARSKKRNMKVPDLSKEEFITWLYKHKFLNLFDLWEESNFDKMKAPSVDRLDDYKPYTFDNMRLVTWEVNNKKSYDDRKNGVNNKINKSVNQIDKITGEILNTFHSQSEASRQTRINIGNINLCCKGTRKSAGGFNWEYIL